MDWMLRMGEEWRDKGAETSGVVVVVVVVVAVVYLGKYMVRSGTAYTT